MIDKSGIFDGEVKQDAEGSLHAIFNLCKVGIAANGSTMAVDMRGANETLYEAIAALAEDGVERLEDAEKARRSKTMPSSVQEEARTA